MIVKNLFRNDNNLVSTNRYLFVNKEERNFNREEKQLLREHDLEVIVDEHPIMKLVCTPTNLLELVVGRLFSEGVIYSLDEIAEIYLCETGNRAKIFRAKSSKESAGILRKEAAFIYKSCCTDNINFFKEIPIENKEMAQPFSWDMEWIWTFEEEINKDTELHARTHSTHSAFIMRDGKILFRAEDIGRHNAIDKVIGMSMMQKVELRKCILFTTGRMPSDVMRKVVRARIPVIVSKEAPTQNGLELAVEAGITVIGNVRHEKMCRYN